jgi:hypothetical protein
MAAKAVKVVKKRAFERRDIVI